MGNMSSIFYSQTFSLFGKLMGLSILFSFVFSIILMCTKGLFFKLEKNPSSALIPVYNLFVLNEGIGINPALTVLYFVPFINLGFYTYVCYKLGMGFGQSYEFTLGLVFTPYVSYWLLGNGKSQLERYKEKEAEEQNQAILNDMLLATDEQIKQMNEEVEEEENKVDSIYKSNNQIDSNLAPSYKASVIQPLKLDFDAIDGKHKIIFIPSPRTGQVDDNIVKKVDTSYLRSSNKTHAKHENEIGIYEIK